MTTFFLIVLIPLLVYVMLGRGGPYADLDFEGYPFWRMP